jgi:hypothetical protein
VTVSGIRANPGDEVDVCVCGHVADWHYAISPAESILLFCREDGTHVRCPSATCYCRIVTRASTRRLSVIQEATPTWARPE